MYTGIIFTPNKNTKNKIALFGSVLTWDWSLKKEEEYQSVIDDEEKCLKYHVEKVLEIMNLESEQEQTSRLLELLDDKSEFELSFLLKDILIYLINNKKISKSLLHKLKLTSLRMKELLHESLKGSVRVPKLWRLRYFLRAELNSKDSDTRLLSNFILKMFEIIIKNNLFKQSSRSRIKNINFISVAIQWADYLTRKKTENESD